MLSKTTEEYDFFNPEKLLSLGAKIEIAKTEIYKQETNTEIQLDESGSVLAGGYLSQKLGWNSGTSVGIGTSGVNANASIEVYRATAGWTPHNKPLMQINDDMTVNFKQQKVDVSVKGGAKLEAGASFSLKSDNIGTSIKAPLISLKFGIENPDIDGALKQIPVDVTSQIISSSIQDASNVVPIQRRLDVPSYAKDIKDRDVYVTDEEKTQKMIDDYKEYFNAISKQGKRDGFGRMYEYDGSYYEGEWKDNEKHDYNGKLFNAYGVLYNKAHF